MALSVAAEAERRMRDFCASRLQFVLRELDGVPGLRCSMPDAGMFLLIDVRETGMSGFEFMSELYRRERVSVLDGGAFGKETRGFVRVCYATDEDLLRRALERIRRFVDKLGG